MHPSIVESIESRLVALLSVTRPITTANVVLFLFAHRCQVTRRITNVTSLVSMAAPVRTVSSVTTHAALLVAIVVNFCRSHSPCTAIGRFRLAVPSMLVSVVLYGRCRLVRSWKCRRLISRAGRWTRYTWLVMMALSTVRRQCRSQSVTNVQISWRSRSGAHRMSLGPARFLRIVITMAGRSAFSGALPNWLRCSGSHITQAIELQVIVSLLKRFR